MERQKRVLAVHDISCIGKCSLTVALPVLSAAGIETSVLPTSVLSTHTGGFTGYTFRDLTEDIVPIAEHWGTLGIGFDAIYTGYLGSEEQIQLMEYLFSGFGKGDTLICVDPVMADNGKLYVGFDESFPGKMTRLCEKADVIVPNITEAVMMLGEPYLEGPYTEEYIAGLVRRLGDAFGGRIILTGVCFDREHLGAAYYDTVSGETGYPMNKLINGHYHGTGDVFGSAALSSLLCGLSLEDSTQVAVDFTVEAIKRTEPEREPRYGVRFEAALPGMMKSLKIFD